MPHRTIIKVVCNPILRKFGRSIVSVFDEDNQFEHYELRNYPENCMIISDEESS
jgi:hypothetical protein